jgi:hypothetical protein
MVLRPSLDGRQKPSGPTNKFCADGKLHIQRADHLKSVENTTPANALVLFGAMGDLAHNKILPALYHMVPQGDSANSTLTGTALNPVPGSQQSGSWHLPELQRLANREQENGTLVFRVR